MTVSTAMAQALPHASVSPCGLHADRPSVGTCARCGRAACQACRNADGVCTECVYQAVSTLPASRGRGKVARMVIMMHAALSGVIGALGLSDLAAVPSSNVDPNTGLETWSTTEAASTVLEIPYLLLTLIAVVLFLRWFFLVTRHLRARALVPFTPLSALASWVVPGVNLVRPMQLMRAVAKAVQEPSAPVRRWWTAWLIALGTIALPISVGSRDFGPNVAGAASVVAGIAMIVAARLCVRVIDTVETGMRRRM